MKNLFPIVAIVALSFASCTTDFELYSYDETVVVYAILDTEADTNYFKITKSFLGNALELAQDYEVSNYDYDEIDVKFIGCFDNATQPDTIQLDTISLYVPYNENSMFYSGMRQLYYYTDRKLQSGKTYKIVINRKSDGATIWAQTTTTNSVVFIRPYSNRVINLRSRHDSVTWFVNDPANNYHTTAAYFDVTGIFHYREMLPGSTDTVSRSIEWNIQSDIPTNLYIANGSYQIYYSPIDFFNFLGNNKYLRENSQFGVQRWIDKFEFRISSIGEELYACHLSNIGTSINIDVFDYSNIVNGRGLMSSRAAKRSFHNLDQVTRYRITQDYDYGFIYEPN